MNYLIIYIDLCLPYDVLSLTFKYLFETKQMFQKDIQNLIRVLLCEDAYKVIDSFVRPLGL